MSYIIAISLVRGSQPAQSGRLHLAQHWSHDVNIVTLFKELNGRYKSYKYSSLSFAKQSHRHLQGCGFITFTTHSQWAHYALRPDIPLICMHGPSHRSISSSTALYTQ